MLSQTVQATDKSKGRTARLGAARRRGWKRGGGLVSSRHLVEQQLSDIRVPVLESQVQRRLPATVARAVPRASPHISRRVRVGRWRKAHELASARRVQHEIGSLPRNAGTRPRELCTAAAAAALLRQLVAGNDGRRRCRYVSPRRKASVAFRSRATCSEGN